MPWVIGPKRVPSMSGPRTTTMEWIWGLGGGGGGGELEEDEAAERETLEAITRVLGVDAGTRAVAGGLGSHRGRGGHRRSEGEG